VWQCLYPNTLSPANSQLPVRRDIPTDDTSCDLTLFEEDLGKGIATQALEEYVAHREDRVR